MESNHKGHAQGHGVSIIFYQLVERPISLHYAARHSLIPLKGQIFALHHLHCNYNTFINFSVSSAV